MTSLATFDIEKYMQENFTPQEIEDSRVISRLTVALETDEAFADKLCLKESLEEAYEFCKDVVQVSLEEFRRIYAQFEADMTELMFKDPSTGELTDEAMELVVGGSIFSKIGHAFKKAVSWVKKNTDYIKDAGKIVVGVAGIVGGIAVCATGGCAPAGVSSIMGGVMGVSLGVESLVKRIKNE